MAQIKANNIEIKSIKHEIHSEIIKVNESMEEIKKSQQFISDQYEEINKKINDVIKQFNEINDVAYEYFEKTNLITSELDALKMRVGSLEQEKLQNFLMINGIEFSENENLMEIIYRS
jgi:methyl-accepting chemotaxis protein